MQTPCPCGNNRSLAMSAKVKGEQEGKRTRRGRRTQRKALGRERLPCSSLTARLRAAPPDAAGVTSPVKPKTAPLPLLSLQG